MHNKSIEEIYEILRQRLILARKKKDMTQEQLAASSGLDRSHIGYIEQKGKQQRKPTIATLYKLCKALGISLEQLFKGIKQTNSKS